MFRETMTPGTFVWSWHLCLVLAPLFGLAARNGGSNLGRKLHRVEVSPSSFWRRIRSRTRLGTLGAAKLAASVLQVNDDSIGGQVEFDVNNFPVVAKSKKLSVMGIEIVHLPRIQNQRA